MSNPLHQPAVWAASLQPLADTLDRFTHFLRRPRIGKADELPPVNGIEVDPRSSGDIRLFQHFAGEFEAVGCEVRNVGIKIERAVGGQKFGQAGAWQSL